MIVPNGSKEYRWHQKAAAVLYAVFCFEVGIFLIFLPWSRYWDVNYFSSVAGLRDFWSSDYLRGAISGLGVVNLYLSIVEVFRLRRFTS